MQKLNLMLQEEVKKVTARVIGEYLQVPPEKRQELEQQGGNLANILTQNLVPLIDHARISSLLVIMEEGIGNMVMLTPALQNIKFTHPNIKITVWCKEPAAQVIRGWDAVDKVITEFDHEYYDFCFVTIWGQRTYQMYKQVVDNYSKASLTGNLKIFHESIQHMAIADFLDSNSNLSPTHCEIIKGDAVAEFEKRMKEKELITEIIPEEELGNMTQYSKTYNPYIVFGDTALRTEDGGWDVKRWPYYLELAEIINKKYPEYKIVLIGDNQDYKEAAEKNWPANTILDFMGTTNIPQLAYLIQKSSFYIGNDTGPTHIAASVGAKTYAIFAPTLVAKNKPLGNNVTILNKRLPCSPCQYTDKFMTCECMAYHTAQEVYNEIFHKEKIKKNPKVLVVGDYSGGAHRNENYIRRVLDKELHYKTIPYDYRAKLNSLKGDIYGASYDLLNTIVHQEPDYVLLNGGQTLIPEILHYISEICPNIKLYHWYVDNRKQPEVWHRRLASICDKTFWSTGDPKSLSMIFGKNQQPCEFLPITPDDKTFYPMGVNKDIDVLFLGTPHNSERLGLLEYLIDNGVKVQIYGNGSWPEKLKFHAKPGVFGGDAVTLLNRSKIVLNTNIINDVPLYFSDRYFMPMAVKTVGLNRYIPQLEEMFENQKHMVWFKSKEECLELINFLLGAEDKRDYISEEGYKLYKENYTMTTIMKRMFKNV